MTAPTGGIVDLTTETWRKKVQFEKDSIVCGKSELAAVETLLNQIGEYQAKRSANYPSLPLPSE